MTTQPSLPENYAITQLSDKRWYPLKVERWYSAIYPDGYFHVATIPDWQSDDDVSFARRHEAVTYCQQQAQQDEQCERERWQHLVIKSDVYPERYTHCIDLIEAITGYVPMMNRWYSTITIYVPGYFCACKKYHHQVVSGDEWTMEEALQKVAEEVYASYQACSCSQLPTTPPSSSYYTVDVDKEGYPVRFYDPSRLQEVGTFEGPFSDPGEASQEYKACCDVWNAEYLDASVFNALIGA